MQELSLFDCVKLPLPVLASATRASTTPPPRQPAIPVLKRAVVTPPVMDESIACHGKGLEIRMACSAWLAAAYLQL